MWKYVGTKRSRQEITSTLGAEEENVIPIEPFGDASFRKL